MMEEKWIQYKTPIIKDDCEYNVYKVLYDGAGVEVYLEWGIKDLKISFGCVNAVHVCDEGARIRTYDKTFDIKKYIHGNYIGNPLFLIENSNYEKWLKKENYGFYEIKHYAILTRNNLIDVASFFPPIIEELKVKAIDEVNDIDKEDLKNENKNFLTKLINKIIK